MKLPYKMINHYRETCTTHDCPHRAPFPFSVFDFCKKIFQKFPKIFNLKIKPVRKLKNRFSIFILDFRISCDDFCLLNFTFGTFDLQFSTEKIYCCGTAAPWTSVSTYFSLHCVSLKTAERKIGNGQVTVFILNRQVDRMSITPDERKVFDDLIKKRRGFPPFNCNTRCVGSEDMVRGDEIFFVFSKPNGCLPLHPRLASKRPFCTTRSICTRGA